MSEPITKSESEDVASRKRMKTKATLYRDGTLVMETFSKSLHPTEALRGHVLAVIYDGAGRAIWISKDYKCKTRCARLDFSCASSGTEVFIEHFPEVIGQFAANLDIVQSDEGLGHFRETTMNAIKTATELAPEILAVIALLA